MELILVRDEELLCYISRKRLNKKNVGPLLNGAGDVVKADRDHPGYKEKLFPSENSQLFAQNG